MLLLLTINYFLFYREEVSDPPKPEAIAFEIALRNELLGTNISEIPVLIIIIIVVVVVIIVIIII